MIVEESGDSSLGGLNFRIYLILTIIGASGILAIFIPFTWDNSPLNAVFDKYMWRLGWPCFFPILVSIASLRLLFSKTLSRTEQVIAYLLSLTSVCITLSFYFVFVSEMPSTFKEWLSYIIPLIMVGFAIFVLIRFRNNATFMPVLAIFSMQFAYLANILLCLIGFLGEWQIGAYFSLVTAIIYLTQISVFCFTIQPVIKKFVPD